GQAEPPMIVRRSVVGFTLFSRMNWMRPFHTVGTPAENVTRSFSNRSKSDLPSRAGPGNTILAPIIGAENGIPHAFGWNIGTTGSTQSRDERHMASGMQVPYACRTDERWLNNAPLGLPVVPEV